MRHVTKGSSSSLVALDEDEVVLWFEHDLYDQLHLVQILDRLDHPRASTVLAGDYLAGPSPSTASIAGWGVHVTPQSLWRWDDHTRTIQNHSEPS